MRKLSGFWIAWVLIAALAAIACASAGSPPSSGAFGETRSDATEDSDVAAPSKQGVIASLTDGLILPRFRSVAEETATPRPRCTRFAATPIRKRWLKPGRHGMKHEPNGCVRRPSGSVQ